MIGQERVVVTLEVNGEMFTREVEARLLLVDLLRDELGLTATHVGCDSTNCGACTVIVDGDNVKSCTMFAAQADGKSVRTAEGLASDSGLNPLQRSFHEKHALQCGYCTPGMLMSATALLERDPDPSPSDVRHGLAGNLCRCTGYEFIVEAVLDAAEKSAERGVTR